jgi:hypothetical protein
MSHTISVSTVLRDSPESLGFGLLTGSIRPIVAWPGKTRLTSKTAFVGFIWDLRVIVGSFFRRPRARSPPPWSKQIGKASLIFGRLGAYQLDPQAASSL